MQMPLPLNDVATPADLPAWLATFIDQARAENQTLLENGAGHAVAARVALLNRLIQAAKQYQDTEVTVGEASSILGRHPETIRRAVRSGALPGGRTKPGGRMHIRRGDLDALAAPNPGAYDPNTDAQDIARRKRPL